MKVRFTRWYNATLTTLLSMLGLGCSSDEPVMYGPYVPMYGVPATEFLYNGLVTDEAGTPVQGIKTSVKIVIPLSDGKKEVYGQDSVLTDASGHYQMRIMGAQNNETKLLVEDIDGEANGGEFQSDTLDIDFEKMKIKEGEGQWNRDSYEISQDIKLKKK